MPLIPPRSLIRGWIAAWVTLCLTLPSLQAGEDSLDPATRELARLRGQAIVAEAFGLLRTNLVTAVTQAGVSNALPFCSVAALPLTTNLAARHGVSLRRVSHRPRNPANRATREERDLLDAFARTLKASSSIPPKVAPVITTLSPGTVSYFAPIILHPELCLKCHGLPDQDITASDLALIRRLYPADEAVGFRLGELRGAWRVDFPASSLASPESSPPTPAPR
ncbi:MAG: DUF3365 domain-containing protein [Verrucomicrobiales bacterium]|nr:DUF3365 domain-containing protein [Verrucomicrobiales bacterium]